MLRHMLLLLTTLLLLNACTPYTAVSGLGTFTGLTVGSDQGGHFEPEQGTSDRQPHGPVVAHVGAYKQGKALPGTPEDVWVYTAVLTVGVGYWVVWFRDFDLWHANHKRLYYSRSLELNQNNYNAWQMPLRMGSYVEYEGERVRG